MNGTVTPCRPRSCPGAPCPSGDQRPGGWRWLLPVLLLLAGGLIFCHGCHRGDHDVDDELAVHAPDER